MSKFLDAVTITVKAGDGGDGCLAFRREKYVPKGGPSGGDGGRGGDVVLVASSHLNTLLPLHYTPLFRAARGQHGLGSTKHGKDADAIEVRVPIGTQVFDAASGELLADLDRAGARHVAARGGEGGRGNARFKSSTNRAPRRHEPGRPGSEAVLRLELKLLADVGLLGFPNAGKSTLLSRLSRAHPKIAAYPFTTLEPHLGVVAVSDFESFVVADIPGIIEGASEGRGLGRQFLKHLDRCKLLCHLVEVLPEPAPTPIQCVRALRKELEKASPDLAKKPRVLVLTKCDTLTADALAEARSSLALHARKSGAPFFVISAVTGAGVEELKKALFRRVLELAGAAE